MSEPKNLDFKLFPKTVSFCVAAWTYWAMSSGAVVMAQEVITGAATQTPENATSTPNDANNDNVKVNSSTVNNSDQPIVVDGDGVEEEVNDGELQYLDQELNKQNKQIKLNSKKTQKYKKLSKTTEKLSNVTEQYVEEKKNSEGVIKEYNLKIKCLMDESETDPECLDYAKENNKEKNKDDQNKAVISGATSNGVQDQTSLQQSAPQVVPTPAQPIIIQNVMPQTAVPAAEKSTENNTNTDQIPNSLYPEPLVGENSKNYSEQTIEQKSATLDNSDKMKVYPFMGMTSYQGEGIYNVQTSSHLGVRIESMPYAHFIMGLGYTYNDLSSPDFGYTSSFYDSGYEHYFGAQREVKYTSSAVDLYVKGLIIQSGKFSPYILAGVGYTMADLKYDDNRDYRYQTYSYGGESINSNFVTGTVAVGVDYSFTNTFGANVEFGYQRGLNNLNSNNNQSQYYPDLVRLQRLADQFADANAYQLQAGILIFF